MFYHDYDPIWDDYKEHRDLNRLREDVLTTPWYRAAPDAHDSLLMRAVQSCDADAVKALISVGESPTRKARGGFTFLHQAIDEAREESQHDLALDVISALLDGGADPNVIGADGATPLHRAGYCGLIKAARLLLARGANIEARTLIDGELTPLMCAACAGQVEMFRFLLNAGADPRAISSDSLTHGPLSIRGLVARRENSSRAGQILAILDGIGA